MPTRGDNGHSHELDYAFKAVGYELTNMVEAVEQMDWFERRIDDFDLVYCPPLSAFVRNEENSMRWAPVPFDLRKHAPTIARWIQAGGVLTMVDVNDPDMLAWLDAMDPKMAATTESCSFPPAVLMEPTGPVLFLPRRAEFGCEWGDLSSETNVLLRGVTVCDGASDGETPPLEYGDVVFGGTLVGCTVSGNCGEFGGGAAYTTLIDCSVVRNAAAKNGGGAANVGIGGRDN